jgi:hypothetical protein
MKKNTTVENPSKPPAAKVPFGTRNYTQAAQREYFPEPDDSDQPQLTPMGAGTTPTKNPIMGGSEPTFEPAIEAESEVVSAAQSAVKPSIKPAPVAPAKATANQSSSPQCRPPNPPKTAKQADEAPPELPSSKPGKINLNKFHLSQDIVEHGGGTKLLTVVPVRKPSKECWFRARPNMDFRVKVRVIELKDGQRETYLVDPDLWVELEGESTFVSKLLVPILTRQQALIIWPIRLPGSDGRIDDWNASALEAAKIAVSKWVRLSPNMPLGANDIRVGPDPQPEVVWPDYSFEQIIDIAFRDKYISTLDHPIIRQLRP